MITIRSVEPDDYEALQKLFRGPKVIWGTLQLPNPSLEMVRKRISETPPGTFQLAACSGEEIVGQLDLFTFPNRPRRRHAGALGMAVRDDFQGQGVGSALMQEAVQMADNWLNLLRLELEVYTDNTPAVQLYKKFGFIVEGTHTRYAYRDGQYVDVYSMARFKPGY